MIFAFGLFFLGFAFAVTVLWATDLPDIARLILLWLFLPVSLSSYAIRCPRCRWSVMDIGTMGQLTFQKAPGRTCVGCGRDRLWVWPLQDRLKPEGD